jgi:hypothetical protein
MGDGPEMQPPGPQPLPPEAFAHWYGPWEPLDPGTIAEFMDGFDRPWWIIGGWSIEAFTGVRREHEDMDISILSGDAEAFRLFLGERYTPWNMDSSWLRPFDDRFREIQPDSQLWIREHALAPWILDVPLTPETDGRWTNKRRPEQTAAVADVTWVADDGLPYLRPEVALMMKAQRTRAKDEADAVATIPLLDDEQRRWLSEALEATVPQHPWLDRL